MSASPSVESPEAPEQDPWEPQERDWKEFAEQAQERDLSYMFESILDTTCPKCGHKVGALIIDGPDPVFADVQCPRWDVCGHIWNERIA